MHFARIARGASFAAVLLLASAGHAAAAGWSATVAPDVVALASAGNHLFALSYQTAGMPRLTAQALDPRTGQKLWNLTLDHMRSDRVHAEAVGTRESLYVTVADPTNGSAGYLLSLAVEPSAFKLLVPRPGELPGVAVTRGTLWTTTGGAGRPVRWRSLDARHRRFAGSLGRGGASGCIGRPTLVGSWLVLAERGGLVVARAARPTRERFIRIGACTWGDPVQAGNLAVVMAAGTEGGPMVLTGVDPAAASVRWRVAPPPNPARVRYVPTVTVSGGLVLATYATQALVVTPSGAVRRRIPLENVTHAVAGAAGRVACALRDRRVVVVDLRSGAVRERVRTAEPVGALHVMRGRLYVGAGEIVQDLGPL